jgi:hypothetical protein
MNRRGWLLGAVLLLLQCSKPEEHAEPRLSEAQPPVVDAKPTVGVANPVQPAEAPDPPASSSPMTKAEKAKAITGITQLQSLMRRRSTLGRESDDACDARHTKDLEQVEALAKQIGKDNLDSKTRFSSKPPFLDATVDTFVVFCIGCIGLDEEVDRKECSMAVTVLRDLAETLKAEK